MSLLDQWSREDFRTVEEGVLVARHKLADSGLFTDEALAEIIDSYPVTDLSVNTMGVEPCVFDWREGDRNGVDGETLIALVRRGRLWINCRNMLVNQPRYAQAIHSLFDDIEANKPGFRAEQRTANLLISSPGAWVPYHVDMPVNMLWHIRGKKRVWVYPYHDNRFASPLVLGKVCAGEWSEEIPYDPSFDRYALVFDAEPGQVITWPQLAPHRVENLDGLNVSLSTEHKNARAKRRINVHTANNWLRKKGRVGDASIGVDGVAAHAKQWLARGLRYAAKFTGQSKPGFTYPKTFVVDPSAEHGYRLLDDDGTANAAPHLEVASIKV